MTKDDIEAVARAIARVMLNGGDPEQDAVRWNGTEMEPQDFPAWRDFRDEANHTIAALEARGWQRVPEGWVVVERKTIVEAHAVMRECGWQLAPASDNVSSDGILEVAAAEIEDKFRAMLAAKGE